MPKMEQMMKKIAVLLGALLNANQAIATDVIAAGTVSCYIKSSIAHKIDPKGNVSLKRKSNNGVFQMKYSLESVFSDKFVTFSKPLSIDTNYESDAPYVPSIFEKINLKDLKISGDFVEHKDRNIHIYKYFMRPEERLTLSAEGESLANWHAVGVFPDAYGNDMGGLSTLMACEVDKLDYSKFYEEVYKAVKEQK